MTLQPGDAVEKVSGYRFDGVVRATFFTGAGALRHVVESVASPGLLHNIFSPEQLRRRT